MESCLCQPPHLSNISWGVPSQLKLHSEYNFCWLLGGRGGRARSFGFTKWKRGVGRGLYRVSKSLTFSVMMTRLRMLQFSFRVLGVWLHIESCPSVVDNFYWSHLVVRMSRFLWLIFDIIGPTFVREFPFLDNYKFDELEFDYNS